MSTIYAIHDDLWVSRDGAVLKMSSNPRDHSYMLIHFPVWHDVITPYWDEMMRMQTGAFEILRSDCTDDGPIMGLANALLALEALESR